MCVKRAVQCSESAVAENCIAAERTRDATMAPPARAAANDAKCVNDETKSAIASAGDEDDDDPLIPKR